MTEDRKGHGSPLPSSTFTETPSTSSIHTCNQTMLPVVVSKVNLVTLSLEPSFFFFLIIKAGKSILSVHQGIFFLQTTIICFKSKSSFLTSLCYSEDALGYMAGRGGKNTKGPLRECDDTQLIIKDPYFIFLRQKYFNRDYKSLLLPFNCEKN